MKTEFLSVGSQVLVADLYSKVFRENPWNETWSVESALQVVCDTTLTWLVALGGETDVVVGFVAGCIGSPQKIHDRFGVPAELCRGSKRIGYLAELGVAPGFRRAGVARLLTATMLNVFRKGGIDRFMVRTRPGTGNYPWYVGRGLSRLFVYDDGRVIFGHNGVPEL